ncbi:hypothetical protein B0A49_04227 [Cryomyces minteri]|uniref:Uncharacterized protein n=2 Tax=Cryomyces minteri TaxID=331657 RepID=A0A4U0XNG1_9PEZI|nr:hypothetical protein B0A49_04227 [Cryomyces minteri]
MNRLHHSHNVFHSTRNAAAAPEALQLPLEVVPTAAPTVTRTLARRADTTTSSSSVTRTCAANDNSAICQKPTNSSATLPITLGAVIPITCALIVLFFLHRRHVKKTRKEDADDKYRSLDFGMDEVPAGKGKKTSAKDVSKMTITDAEKSVRRGRGLSLDMGNPYLLSAGLQDSRSSVHSLSRTLRDGADPYRSVTVMKSDSDLSRSYLAGAHPRSDNASTYTTNTRSSGGVNDGANSYLLKNASKMSRSFAPSESNATSSQATPLHGSPIIQHPEPARTTPPPRNASLPPPAILIGGQAPTTDYPQTYSQHTYQERSATSAYYMPRAETYKQPTRAVNQLPFDPRQPRLQSMEASIYDARSSDFVGDSARGSAVQTTSPSPVLPPQIDFQETGRHSLDAPIPAVVEPAPQGLGVYGFDQDGRRVSMNVRPLPPDDPTDSPEQRANRIRSFYKEYFDDSKSVHAKQQPSAVYYEDNDQSYLTNGAVRVPQARAPYAQPVGSRAMSPSSRGPPHLIRAADGRASNMSNSRYMPPGYQQPRSAMSQQSMRPQETPKRRGPPPAPLQSLPTPHLLKEDSMVFSPIDFAPPATYRDRVAGRPESPLGVQRPYSPSVPVHVPLVTSFDDLSVMPSPHALRKSGTFTALDFAPSPRFARSDVASDAGSVLSGRSGISAMQRDAVRAGAYRVSRIPKEVVGTKDDITASLRPTWDLRG